MKWIFVSLLAVLSGVHFAPAFTGANTVTRIFLAIMASVAPVLLAIIL